MTVTRLSPLDATFLHVEDDVTHMHIGSVGIFEGPPPPQAELLAAIAGKLHLAPSYRQRVAFVPLQAGRPVWVDDPHFRLAYHVRRTALPSPGGDEQLRTLVGRVMSHQLDRARPLWELWVIEGLADGRWALLSKLHHAMVDGVSGSSLLTAIMDMRRDAEVSEPLPWTPAPAPSGRRLVAGALADRAAWLARETIAAARSIGDPAGVATQTAHTVRGLAAYAGMVRQPEPTALNGPIGPHRCWDFARADLGDVKLVRAAFGGTVNDVVLAAISAGFRDLLQARGEPIERTLRSLVPVSVRARDETSTFDNKVSAMFADLPVEIEDPVERLHAVSERLIKLKASYEAEAGEVITALAGLAPEALLSLGGHFGTRAPQRMVNTVTTNVPGPQHTLYFAGCRMLETFPYVPLGGHVRVGVAIYSYDGALGFGVTGDADAAPDIGILCTGIERGMHELVTAAAPSRPPRGRVSPAAK